MAKLTAADKAKLKAEKNAAAQEAAAKSVQAELDAAARSQAVKEAQVQAEIARKAAVEARANFDASGAKSAGDTATAAAKMAEAEAARREKEALGAQAKAEAEAQAEAGAEAARVKAEAEAKAQADAAATAQVAQDKADAKQALEDSAVRKALQESLPKYNTASLAADVKALLDDDGLFKAAAANKLASANQALANDIASHPGMKDLADINVVAPNNDLPQQANELLAKIRPVAKLKVTVDGVVAKFIAAYNDAVKNDALANLSKDYFGVELEDGAAAFANKDVADLGNMDPINEFIAFVHDNAKAEAGLHADVKQVLQADDTAIAALHNNPVEAAKVEAPFVTAAATATVTPNAKVADALQVVKDATDHAKQTQAAAAIAKGNFKASNLSDLVQAEIKAATGHALFVSAGNIGGVDGPLGSQKAALQGLYKDAIAGTSLGAAQTELAAQRMKAEAMLKGVAGCKGGLESAYVNYMSVKEKLEQAHAALDALNKKLQGIAAPAAPAPVAVDVSQLETEKKAKEAEKAKAEQEAEGFQQSIDIAQKKVAGLAKEVSDLDSQITAATPAALAPLEAEKKAKEAEKVQAEKEAEGLKQSIAKTTTQKAAAGAEINRLSTSNPPPEGITTKIQEQNDLLQMAQDSLQTLTSMLTVLQQKVAGLAKEVSDLDGKITAATSAAPADLAQLQAEKQAKEAEKVQAEQEATDSLSTLTPMIAASQQKVAKLAKEVSDLDSKITAAQSASAAASAVASAGPADYGTLMQDVNKTVGEFRDGKEVKVNKSQARATGVKKGTYSGKDLLFGNVFKDLSHTDASGQTNEAVLKDFVAKALAAANNLNTLALKDGAGVDIKDFAAFMAYLPKDGTDFDATVDSLLGSGYALEATMAQALFDLPVLGATKAGDLVEFA